MKLKINIYNRYVYNSSIFYKEFPDCKYRHKVLKYMMYRRFAGSVVYSMRYHVGGIS